MKLSNITFMYKRIKRVYGGNNLTCRKIWLKENWGLWTLRLQRTVLSFSINFCLILMVRLNWGGERRSRVEESKFGSKFFFFSQLYSTLFHFPPSPSIQTDLKKERCSISFLCIVSVYLKKKKKEEEENSMLYELSC